MVDITWEYSQDVLYEISYDMSHGLVRRMANNEWNMRNYSESTRIGVFSVLSNHPRGQNEIFLYGYDAKAYNKHITM